MKIFLRICLLATIPLFWSSCKEDDPKPPAEKVNTIPEFYKAADADVFGLTPPAFTVLSTSSDLISEPQDLDFHKNRNNELWVLNKGSENTGGSTVIYTAVGQAEQAREYRRDGNARHFMALPSALSFSSNGNWGTSANIKDANHNNGSFTGPTLWSSDMGVYARPSGGNGSHLDMLHGSPFSMGIESEKDNIFWVFDGFNGHLVRYDFVNDHGPGNDDHADGIVRRYTEIKLTKEDIPSHIVLDADKKWLYIVDGGTKRILRVNIQTGQKNRNLNLINETLAEHSEYTGVEWEVIVPASAGLKRPCGIEVNKNRLFVSDYESGDVICYDITNNKEIARVYSGDEGITGIKLGPDNHLWYVNALTNEMGRLDPR